MWWYEVQVPCTPYTIQSIIRYAINRMFTYVEKPIIWNGEILDILDCRIPSILSFQELMLFPLPGTQVTCACKRGITSDISLQI